MKVLIADDEQPLLNFLQRGLVAEGLEVVSESQLHNLVATIKREAPQVAILDRMFEQQDSVQLLGAIKALPNPPMVLLLTAVDEVSERVVGLRQGADDYLCKPFDFDELLARIYALNRRNLGNKESIARQLSVANISIDLDSRLITCNGEELSATRIEYDLLCFLMENVGKVVTRERILSRVWQTHSDPLTNIVDVYISRLRQKLPPESGVSIQTLRGNGYRLNIE